jgi:hypothetical protein
MPWLLQQSRHAGLLVEVFNRVPEDDLAHAVEVCPEFKSIKAMPAGTNTTTRLYIRGIKGLDSDVITASVG